MTRAWDEHNWRDVSPPGFMSVRELTPAERQKAERAEEARMQKVAEDYKKSVTARREADAAAEASMDAAVAKASVIKTPAQERAERLGWIPQADGSLVHQSEVQRREAQYGQDDGDGITPEERRAMEQYLAADEGEDDASFWNDE
jgi:hypothetical protein